MAVAQVKPSRRIASYSRHPPQIDIVLRLALSRNLVRIYTPECIRLIEHPSSPQRKAEFDLSLDLKHARRLRRASPTREPGVLRVSIDGNVVRIEVAI